MRTMRLRNCVACTLALLMLTCTVSLAQDVQAVPTIPDLTKGGVLEIEGFYHLGATGAQGRMYVEKFMTTKARQILIIKVAPGSPADGVLAVGDVILGIGEKRFASDARKAFGRAIDEAETEASKGVLKLLRWRKGTVETVALKLRVMGTFSNTAPYDCPKSKKILDEALAKLASDVSGGKWGRFSLEALAFLASGRPEYIKLVRDHLHAEKWAGPEAQCGEHAWTAGYRGMLLTEYYLATGDKYVLPAIREYAVKTAMGQSNTGTWGHSFARPRANGGRLHGRLSGYGELNSAGLPCFLSLVLAKKCGVKHPEIDMAIAKCTRFFGQFVGKGTIGYGFHRPSLEHNSNGRNGDSSNGKNGNAAIIFSVMGKHDYARFFYKLVTSSYDEREFGHSGNSHHQLWGGIGANMGGPKAAAAFARELRWYAALVRKGDGSFAHQPLGGTYGGGAMSATVANSLALAVPLRKIYITGKGSDPKHWLDEAGVKEAIDAGRWRMADFEKMTADQLIDALDCWSPNAREWVAEGLGTKTDKSIVPRLVKMLSADSTEARAGACTALGYQGERAGSAVGVLTKALNDKDAIVRVSASYALGRIGQPSHKAVPEMFKALIATEEDESMQPTRTALAYALGHKPGRSAPLYFAGLFASWPEDANPLAGLDRQVLYPAMSTILKHPSARVRGCGGYMYQYLTTEDIAIMAQDIYDATRELAPGYAMFGDLPRNHGLDMMAERRLAEGIDIAIATVDPKDWGQQTRLPNRFSVLQKYGGAARHVLPQIRELRWDLRKPESRALVEETIKAIESDKNPKQLTSLAALVERILVRAMAFGPEKHNRVNICRKMMADAPDNTFMQAAGLRHLVAMEGAGALADIVIAAGNPDEKVRLTALKLAAGLPGQSVKAACIKQVDTAKGRTLIGSLVILGQCGDKETLVAIRKHARSRDRAVRLAALDTVTALGGKKVLRSLSEYLTACEDDAERTAIEAMAVVACKSVKSFDKGGGLVIAALAKAEEPVRGSMLRILGTVGGAEALEAVAALADGEDRDVRKGALDVLATTHDAAATDVLLARVEKAGRGRAKGEFISACLRRVIIGRVPADKRLAVLDRIIVAGGNSSTSRTALDELPWTPSVNSLRMARTWMGKRDKVFASTSEYAAKVAVAIAQNMDLTDAKQRKAAVEAVREVLTVAKDEATVAAAKAFLAKV